MEKLKLAIVGSRDYPEMGKVREVLRLWRDSKETWAVLSGGARGVDSVAELEAKLMGFEVISYRPVRFGSDGFVARRYPSGEVMEGSPVSDFRTVAFWRNGEIAKDANCLLAFWDGKSTGTADTINKYNARGAVPRIYYPGDKSY